jgi:two-component system sensor histidine kinase KdpD
VALQHFFQESTLVALRELAMRQTAHEVDVRQGDGLEPGVQETHFQSGKADRILIYVTPEPSSAALIRRAKRVADFLHANCFAVCVFPHGDLHGLPEKDREALERHLNFSRNLHIETRVLEGDDVSKTLVDFARLHGITQIFLARPRKLGFPLPFRRTIVQEIVELAKDMQITIVAERERRDNNRSAAHSGQFSSTQAGV